MKKLVLVFGCLLLLPVAGFFSCENCARVGKRSPRYFDITGMDCRNYEITPSPSSAGGYAYKLLSEGDSVGFANHSIRATFQVTYYSHRHQPPTFSAPGAAFALDCVPIAPVNREGLDTLYVITANALSNLRPAGDTINDIIAVGEGVDRPEDRNRFYSIADFIRYNREETQAAYVAFRLTEEPAFKRTAHAFKLIYQLKNGEVYTAQTPSVRFK